MTASNDGDRPAPGARSWFAIEGGLLPLDFPGESGFRFPDALVEFVLDTYSAPGDHVLDPFCGLGTTLRVCARTGRVGTGFERDRELHAFARGTIGPPHRCVHDHAENIAEHDVPPVDLVLCSPPFRRFHHGDDIDSPRYYDELLRVFTAVLPALKPTAAVVVETVNLRGPGGRLVPRAFETALALGRLMDLVGEHVCCTSDLVEVVPGSEHSYLLVFRKKS